MALMNLAKILSSISIVFAIEVCQEYNYGNFDKWAEEVQVGQRVVDTW